MHDASLQYPRQPAMRSQPTSCVPHYPFHPVKSHVLEPMKAHRHQQNDSPERITQFNFNCQRAKKRVQKNTQTKHIILHNACHVYKNAMIDEKHQKWSVNNYRVTGTAAYHSIPRSVWTCHLSIWPRGAKTQLDGPAKSGPACAQITTYVQWRNANLFKQNLLASSSALPVTTCVHNHHMCQSDEPTAKFAFLLAM